MTLPTFCAYQLPHGEFCQKPRASSIHCDPECLPNHTGRHCFVIPSEPKPVPPLEQEVREWWEIAESAAPEPLCVRVGPSGETCGRKKSEHLNPKQFNPGRVSTNEVHAPTNRTENIPSAVQDGAEAATPEPIPMELVCPKCGAQHLDEGEWATRPHKTHQCQSCKHEWRPYEYPTVGVASKPGEPQLSAEEWYYANRGERATWAETKIGVDKFRELLNWMEAYAKFREGVAKPGELPKSQS